VPGASHATPGGRRGAVVAVVVLLCAAAVGFNLFHHPATAAHPQSVGAPPAPPTPAHRSPPVGAGRPATWILG
jgi:hypothetical protein